MFKIFGKEREKRSVSQIKNDLFFYIPYINMFSILGTVESKKNSGPTGKGLGKSPLTSYLSSKTSTKFNSIDRPNKKNTNKS